MKKHIRYGLKGPKWRAFMPSPPMESGLDIFLAPTLFINKEVLLSLNVLNWDFMTINDEIIGHMTKHKL